MWTNTTITEFWQQNEADFAGDVTASEIIRLSRKYVKGKVLDIGAGSGALIERLPGAIGVDIAPKHPRVGVGDIANLPFGDGSFDAIFATDILEHLPDEVLRKGLAEIKRVLIGKGSFILTVPYKENLKQSLVYCPSCKSRFHRWGHLQYFNETIIRIMLTSLDFGAVNVKVLPLGLMAEHWIIRHFWRLFVRVGFIKANTMFVVAEKQ